jgi:uncharacterized protein YbjT (DUF2867 family)
MLILVTGATGFVAGQLIPRLLERGHQVRAMARDPTRLHKQPWSTRVDLMAGDVMMAATLPAALHGVHTAYYLIHSMASGRGYTERDLVGARNFAEAAAAAGVQHILYLGGLADPQQPLAPHLRSRIETGAMLRQGPVPVTEFRCGVIAGAGSGSFELIRRITELLPVIPGPPGLRKKTQPIAARNAVDYLLAGLDHPQCQGRVFEIGGPEITTYADLMLRYARVRGLQRGVLLIPGLPVWLMALGTRVLTRVPHGVARAVLGGLANDSVVQQADALRAFPEVKLIDYTSAAREAVAQMRRARNEHAVAAGAWVQAVHRIVAIGRAMLPPRARNHLNASWLTA